MNENSSILFSVFLFLWSVTLVGCSTLPPDYEGDDVGFAVAGIAARQGTSYSMYKLMFREIGAEQANMFLYSQEANFSRSNADYSDEIETGAIVIKPLKPGRYEIYNTDTFYNTGFVQNNYFLKDEVSIPFTIYPGEVTYLGHFQANKIMGKNVFGVSIPAGAFFVVSDREEHDIAIAESKQPSIAGKAVSNSFVASNFEQLPGFQLTSTTFAK